MRLKVQTARCGKGRARLVVLSHLNGRRLRDFDRQRLGLFNATKFTEEIHPFRRQSTKEELFSLRDVCHC